MSKANNAKEWIPYLGLDFLCKSDSQETKEELKEARTSASSSSSACAAVTRPLALTSSSPSAAKTALWSATPEYPRECKMAETHGDAEPIHKITVRTVRIKIDRGDMPVNAVWLAVGRLGYMAFKADNEGQAMDWLDPLCLLCGMHASVDHVAAAKHIEKTKDAADWTKRRGYGEVLDWIQKDAQEVIHVASSSPKKKPKATSEASTSDDDVPAPGAEKITIQGVATLSPRQSVTVEIAYPDGSEAAIEAKVRIDTENELDYYRNGGILHYVLRQLARAS